ncbi:hypothetical protein ACI6Q2_01445 [Chitinophagaceae bacterium LWZ2-11]
MFNLYKSYGALHFLFNKENAAEFLLNLKEVDANTIFKTHVKEVDNICTLEIHFSDDDYVQIGKKKIALRTSQTVD